MKKFWKKNEVIKEVKKDEELEKEVRAQIKNSVINLRTVDPTSEEYSRIVKNVTAMNNLIEDDTVVVNKVSKDVQWKVLGSVASVILIIIAEKGLGLILNTKAFNFVNKS